MQNPVRLGVAGLTHGHVSWVLERPFRTNITLVGIAESRQDVVARYAQRFPFDTNLVYADLEAMLDATKPEAVVAFGSIYDHLAVVRACAPRGIHVMVEKPLAFRLEHAQEMAALARQHHIHLLTNYETTWYASNHWAYELVHSEKRIGDVWKVVVHDGHWGPQEIGCSAEFLEWLTDPAQNGGGALIDFGCYGANLMTWLMGGERPLTVTAVTQQIKPHIYPHVDDEATIILTYPRAQAIVQGSWNWPYHRKDMEIYGQTGIITAVNRDTVQIQRREGRETAVSTHTLSPRPIPYNDPFAYFAAVVRGTITVADTDLSSLANNMTVVQILAAARQSASSGATVTLAEFVG